jgi:LysM repeat protein
VRGRLGLVHHVRAGDTLAGIAKRYHVSVRALRQWNHVGDILHVGQKIYIRKDIF